MAESIAQQIRKILEQNPEITNKELYSKFPKIRPNTIRHYKSSFFRNKEQPAPKAKATPKKSVPKSDKVNHISIKEKIASRAQKAAGKFQKTDIEKRIAALEKKVDKLTDLLTQNVPAATAKKSGPFAKGESIDKRIKELEQNLLGFINEKRNKIKSDMSSLDELQQVMSKRISQFLASLKSKG